MKMNLMKKRRRKRRRKRKKHNKILMKWTSRTSKGTLTT